LTLWRQQFGPAAMAAANAAVPEPAAAILAILVGAGLGRVRRRR
jgi:hypothetical protein